MNDALAHTFRFYGQLSLILSVVAIAHEAGHALAAVHCHTQIRQLRIGLGPVLCAVGASPRVLICWLPLGATVGFEGRRRPDGSSRRTLGQEALILAAGPLTGLLLAIVAALGALLLQGSPWAMPLAATAGISLFVTVLNLLPVPGLDGGNLLLLAFAAAGLQMAPASEARMSRRCQQLLALLGGAGIVCLTVTQFAR